MKKILVYSIFITMLMLTLVTAHQENTTESIFEYDKMTIEDKVYIDITPQEAWQMMSTAEDGIQIPIDVRRLDEYVNEKIILPDKNDWVRWFPYELTSDGPGPIKNEGIFLDIFMNHYKEKEIIIYCRTGRRTALAAEILVDNGFSGIVYNMLGGITEWKSMGLPTT